jgi:hypothetical protein
MPLPLFMAAFLAAQKELPDGVGPYNNAPSDIVWGGSHTVAEDAALGTVIGDALAATDPDAGDTVTFSLADDANGLFDINGSNQVIVSGVLDYETATSHSITIRATDSAGATYDEAFSVTVTDVSESPADDPPPDGDIIVEPGEFTNPPVVTTVDGGIKFHGKKATGASGKFIYDIGAPQAGHRITMRYDPDFSLLANDGVTAFVGFGLKQGNNFRLSGLKGDGSTGLKAYEIYGSNWNQTTGHSTSDGGAAAHGTQAGPNWLQIEVDADGETYTLRSSSDGSSWTDEFTDIVPSPHDEVSDFTSFGIAVYLESADAGNFSVKIDLWIDEVAGPGPHRYWRINVTAITSGLIAAIGELEMQETEFGPNVCTGGTPSADTEFNASFLATNAFDGNLAGSPWASTSSSLPHWLRYDFGAGNDVEINAVGMHARTSSLETMPTAFDVQFSDDGSSWTTAWSESGLSWSAREFKKFVNPAYTEPGYTGSPWGSYTHWRYYGRVTDGGAFFSSAEIEWRATPGGADQATGGSSFSGGDFSGSFDHPRAFDNNNATLWASAGTNTYIGYGHGSAVSVGQVAIRSRQDSAANGSPRDFIVQFSTSSGGPWTTAWVVTGSTGWGLGETRTFTDPNYV